MLHLFKTKDELNVVSDQFGQPTNANDLAEAVMKIIQTQEKECDFSIYLIILKYWCDFAKKLRDFQKVIFKD